MRKLSCFFILLLIVTSLNSCIHEDYGYRFHFYANEEQGKIVVDKNFNPTVYLCKDSGMCELGCDENSYLVLLLGGKNGSRELPLIAIPNEGYKVKAWYLNGVKVENNCSETFTATATSENGYNAVITVEFEAIN